MDTNIVQLYEQQVLRTPDHPAALFKDQCLSYRQLNEKANRVAHFLRSRGVGPDTIVAVALDRSLEMIIGIYGILKAGGAYLPISPANPAKRIDYILKESNCRTMFADAKRKNTLTSDSVGIFDVAAICETGPNSNPEPVNSPQDLVYVIYTSGSTGKPKGVLIQHGSLVNRLMWMQKEYPLTSDDRILQKTPFFFDVSVWEMFWWSLVGASVFFMPPGGEKFPQFIVEAVHTKKITVMHFVPSMMSVFLEYLRNSQDTVRQLTSLKQVFASGEKLTPSHVQAFNEILFNTGGTRLSNLYGPTEATVDVSYYDCPTQGEISSISIGKAIDNIQLLILDSDDNPIQPSSKGFSPQGELCIAGIGLARGYLNRPELTHSRFVNSRSSTFYRTGDLARWDSAGNIDFLGRKDHQVKIHGLRIELGEIEAALVKHPHIRECVVLVKTRSKTITMLTAYIIAESELDVSPDTGPKQLKRFLKEIFPDYMVPNVYIFMDSFPLTPSGKLDRKALPEPTFR